MRTWNEDYIKNLKTAIEVGEEVIKQQEGFLITKKGWTDDQLAKIEYGVEDMKNIVKADKERLNYLLKEMGVTNESV